MPQDAIGWIVVLAALTLGFALGRASGRGAAQRDALMGAPRPLPQPPVKPAPELVAQVQAALEAGQVITAIKLMREGTGMGLTDAKAAVDRMAGKR